jgi:hypothetical protein
MVDWLEQAQPTHGTPPVSMQQHAISSGFKPHTVTRILAASVIEP